MTSDSGISRTHTAEERQVSLTVGRNIRRLRKERKMSSIALSQALRARGIRLQDTQIRRMETGALHGRSTPAVTVDHLVAFAWVLGVATTDLLTPSCEADNP